MGEKRRKGVAILDTSKGILLVAGKSKKFSLPGGGAEKWESRKKATIRELYEETDLKTRKIKFLFKYIGNKWHNHKRNLIRNHTKVFLVNAEGIPKPKHEIRYIQFWKPKSNLRISNGAYTIIKKYLNEHKK
jgi:8-oxo-dGTP diphosphatase